MKLWMDCSEQKLQLKCSCHKGFKIYIPSLYVNFSCQTKSERPIHILILFGNLKLLQMYQITFPLFRGWKPDSGVPSYM